MKKSDENERENKSGNRFKLIVSDSFTAWSLRFIYWKFDVRIPWKLQRSIHGTYGYCIDDDSQYHQWIRSCIWHANVLLVGSHTINYGHSGTRQVYMIFVFDYKNIN